jgi:hypothetical protein
MVDLETNSALDYDRLRSETMSSSIASPVPDLEIVRVIDGRRDLAELFDG